ncbi:endo-1,4-beta-xylanase [Bythopirellula polymerisocia]|uniref:Beta-xylanase n=1 Tax=Bythopirellula polymerisocia TaxID=2528003 RepID=A0A5C6CXS7_9BACT|nr:endo-1,4-beta-xylanase [Bythopirellula polymerisocia]TWU28364.1 Endo-1,4-beta-xylanase A precursor [Bythopirellula polymerisocia]
MNKTDSNVLFQLVFCCICVQVNTASAQQATLKEAFKEDFLVGTALGNAQVLGKVPAALELAAKQFNSITPENLLKWESVHPEPDKYDFKAADQLVDFGRKHDMFIVGHTLVWHSQTPKWVFEDEQGKPLERDALLERMRDHIHTVVGRYKGRIHGWDVVNEAIVTEPRDERKGAWRETPWSMIIGPDYIQKAFQYAHEADPDAELYYNDFDEWKLGKRDYIAKLVSNLKDNNIRIDGIGLQGHWGLDYPTVTEMELMFQDLSQLGVKLMITELDINVLPRPSRHTGADVAVRFQDRPEFNPFATGLPDDMQKQLANRYEIIFRIFHDHRDSLDRVTFWGVDDGQSWLNYWPIAGRTNYPLLFDRNYQPKPAFYAVLRVAEDEK